MENQNVLQKNKTKVVCINKYDWALAKQDEKGNYIITHTNDISDEDSKKIKFYIGANKSGKFICEELKISQAKLKLWLQDNFNTKKITEAKKALKSIEPI